MILSSVNGGQSWNVKKFKEYNYDTIFFFDAKHGFIAGDKGVIIYTSNAGERWKKNSLPTYRINSLIKNGQELWAFGDSGMKMVSNNQGKRWKGHEGRSIIAMLLNFFAPFAFIWILFFLMYISLPNTKVSFKSALIGSSFTGAVWVIFILFFIVYIKAFARGTFAIYGTLAAIPLFLLMVYASSLIILYGAEVSYTIMHPESYMNLKKIFKETDEIRVFFGLAILEYIYKKFESGKGPTYFKELLSIASQKVDQVDFFTKHFMENKLLIQNADNGYAPANSSENVRLIDVIDSIHNIGLDIPAYVKKTHLKDYLNTLFDSINKNRKKVVGATTLRDLIQDK
jgi:hypothetical protein